MREREALVNKYVPVALNSVFRNMMEESAGEGRAEVAERKIRMKYEKDGDAIVEEDEYGEEIEDSSEADEDAEEAEPKDEEADDDQIDTGKAKEASDEEDEELDGYLDKVYDLKKRRSEVEDDKQPGKEEEAEAD